MTGSKLNSGDRRLIAVALGNAGEFELGILEGVRNRLSGWELVVLAGGYESPLRQLAATGELAGAIGDFVSDAWVDDLRKGGVSVVQIAIGSRLAIGPNVGADFFSLGSDGAEALLRSGCVSLGFAGTPGQHASAAAWKGFSDAAQRAGRDPALAAAGTAPLLQDWLSRLPRPCGVLSASDRLARMVVTAARNLSWELPKDLATIGVGNQRIESILAQMQLSSFVIPGRELGRAAADALSGLIARGETGGDASVIVPVRLIERESSLRSTSGLARAVALVRSRFSEPLQVTDIARTAGMSRRSLEIAMQNDFGCAPAEFLAAERRREAERLLADGDLGIGEIGAACGYPELPQFSAVFKRWTGLSPRAFRLRARELNAKRTRRRSRSIGSVTPKIP